MANILVVDDEESIRLILRKVLEDAGHTVDEASNGIDGLARMGKTRYDLVIIDVVMPEKGGLETLMEMHGSHPDMKAIIISGKIDLSSEAFRNFSRLFGGTWTLNKPFHLATVTRTVAEALQAGSQGGKR